MFLRRTLDVPTTYLESIYLLPTFFLPSSFPPLYIYQKNISYYNCPLQGFSFEKSDGKCALLEVFLLFCSPKHKIKIIQTKDLINMKKIIACLLAIIGLTTVCAQGNYETDEFKTKSGKTVKMHALMHASIRIEHDGKEIEIDPCSKLGNKTVDYTAMPKADYILVTHEHGDHYDAATLKLLSADKTQLVMNQRCVDKYGSGKAMKNGDKMKLSNDITIEAVPAYNTTEGHLQFHPKGRDNGYILTIDGLRIYIAGDTEDIEELKKIKNIDIAFLPCNQPYTMTPEQLARAAKTIKPKVLFPYHYGQTDVSVIPSLLKGEKIDVRIRHYE